MNIVVLLLLALLLSLGVVVGEASSIDLTDLSFWLWLAVAPGIVMLVVLGIHYRGNPRVNAKPSAPTERLAEVEPDELERLKRNAIEQLNGISAVLRSSTATTLKAEQTSGQAASSATGRARRSLQDSDGSRDSAIGSAHFDKPVDTGEETVSQTHLPIGSAIEATRHVTRDKALTELAAKMRIMAELTSRLHDKRQTLIHIPIGPLSASDNTTPNRHYLSFTLGDERFAVSTSSVYAIVEASQLISKPSIPPKLRRAIRLRNALVPVIDLGAHLGGQPIKIGWSTSIVILEVSSGDRMRMIGVVVDAVGKILEIPPVEIEPPAASDSKIRNDFTIGTVTVNNHTVALLDIERGFSANEFVVLRSAVRSVAQENIPT